MFLSILKLTNHKLHIDYGLDFVTPSLHGWGAFLIRIIWALSPTTDKSRVSFWDPFCANGVAGTPHGEVRDIMLWVVAMLFRPYNDQLESGFPWMKVQIQALVIS